MSGRRLLGLLLTVVLMGAVLWVMFSPQSSSSAHAAVVDLTSSASCQKCHPQVYQEWQSSFHGQSFTDELVLAKEQSNNFRVVSCIPCHAPAPVLEHGIGKGTRVVERMAFREQGVDCLACHRLGNRVAGREGCDSSAPCQPEYRPELAKADLCAPCHNQHETVTEWEHSSFAAAGTSCLDCHMATVERRRPDGTTRIGRSHLFPGSHNRDFMAAALDVRAEPIEADGEHKLRVVLTNTGAGHNFPTDARHRALDLIVTLVRADGVEIPARESRDAGLEGGTARRRFRNPYRGEVLRTLNLEKYGRENTQIPAGASEVLEVPFAPEDVATARIEVIYKLTPLLSDAEGVLLHESEIELVR
jgi:hypothetical protein